MDTGIRVFWLLAGLVSVALGAVGLVLPLLPTTPFLLIAAFAFARSSARLNRWLREHRSFGPLIDNWHRDGSIDLKVKRIAIIVVLLTPVVTWLFDAPFWIIGCQVVVLSAAAVFILTRPLPSEGKESPRAERIEARK
ncbi:MAG: YbaN family protein [Gammaproteobacteria bacterium]|nr:YbaN family protein [Gammaproteobacteria bacterium]